MSAEPRSLAPDLARGLMLLLIALANVPWMLYGEQSGTSFAHAVGASGADAVWQAMSLIMIDGRSYPLFAFLFGYGMWQIIRRQTAAGVSFDEARRLLRRRNAWLLAFGAVHAIILWMGDVLGAYGLVGVIVAWLLISRRDQTLLIWCICLGSAIAFNAFFGLFGGVMATVFDPGGATTFTLPDPAAVTSYPESVLLRTGMWLALTLMQAFASLSIPLAVLLGILAARRGILERPLEHLALLRKVAFWGILVGWVGGVATTVTWFGGAWFAAGTDWPISGAHTLTGVAGGLGYAALFALIAGSLSRRAPSPVVGALTALGKRSLSGYVAQSVLIAPLLCAWGFGWGQWMSSWQGAVFGVIVWLITIAGAVMLERAGRRGPLEALLRRLTYRRATVGPLPVVVS